MKNNFNRQVVLKTFQYYPCKDCTKRTVGCHGSCEEYQKTRNEQNIKNIEKTNSTKTDAILNSMQYASIRKQDRAKGKRI